MIIKEVRARKIKTSDFRDTVEVVINKKYSASVPLGTSTGENEVRPFAKNAGFSIRQINNLKELIGMSFDRFDDLKQVERHANLIGCNSVLALQYAILRAMSDNKVYYFLSKHAYKMPVPLGNVIGGGAHFKGDAADFQEFLLIPRSDKFYDNAFANEYIHKKIGREYINAGKTIEGAYALKFNNMRILDILKNAVKKSEKELGFEIDIGVDVAASSMYKGGRYVYKNYSYLESKKSLKRGEQIEFMNKIISEYNIKYVEDPLQENDFRGFKDVKAELTCGDDLVCTNIARLRKAVGSINAVIIKPNQIGSLIKTKEAIEFAKENKIIPIISHRSGETNDPIISHLAVGFEVPYIKLGIHGKERTAKIKELIKIEKEL